MTADVAADERTWRCDIVANFVFHRPQLFSSPRYCRSFFQRALLKRPRFGKTSTPIVSARHCLASRPVETPAPVVEILDPKERLRTDLRFLTLEQVSLPPQSELFISGYPSALARSEKTAIRGVFLTLETEQIPGNASQPVDPQVDYLFDAGPNIFSGQYTSLDINGMSGSAVGEYRSDIGSGLWTPDRAIHVLAVQTAVLRHQYIRAVSWATVAALLERIEPGLTVPLLERLASTEWYD
jgi:hypothetical protein